MKEALQSAGIIINPLIQNNLIRAIKVGPIWFKQIFITYPTGGSALKAFLKSYHDFAHGYNLGGNSNFGFMEPNEHEKLPGDFMTLASELGYQGQDPKNAWMYVFEIISQDEALKDVQVSRNYVSTLLKSDIIQRVQDIFSSKKLGESEKEEILSRLEKLNQSLGGHLMGYVREDSFEKRLQSLVMRIGNRIWALNKPKYHTDHMDHSAQVYAINDLEGLLNK